MERSVLLAGNEQLGHLKLCQPPGLPIGLQLDMALAIDAGVQNKLRHALVVVLFARRAPSRLGASSSCNLAAMSFLSGSCSWYCAINVGERLRDRAYRLLHRLCRGTAARQCWDFRRAF